MTLLGGLTGPLDIDNGAAGRAYLEALSLAVDGPLYAARLSTLSSRIHDDLNRGGARLW